MNTDKHMNEIYNMDEIYDLIYTGLPKSDVDIEHNKRWEYYKVIGKLRREFANEFIDSPGHFDYDAFANNVEKKYGIRFIKNIEGNITHAFDIIDEKLYVLFLLKWF